MADDNKARMQQFVDLGARKVIGGEDVDRSFDALLRCFAVEGLDDGLYGGVADLKRILHYDCVGNPVGEVLLDRVAEVEPYQHHLVAELAAADRLGRSDGGGFGGSKDGIEIRVSREHVLGDLQGLGTV